MAFIDGISSKITKTGQSALHKTRSMAGVARLNSQISEQEKRINNGYFQIGKLYCSLHAEDYEPDFTTLMDAIKEAERIIADCKQQIQVVKGVKFCEVCGAENPATGAFCSTCGTPLPQMQPQAPQAAPNQAVCQNCGASVPKSMKFCTNCGQPMPMEATPVTSGFTTDASGFSAADPSYPPAPTFPVAQDSFSGMNSPMDRTMEAAMTPPTEPAQAMLAQDAPADAPAEGAPQTTAAATPAAFCPSCGAQLEDGATFCTECGARIG